MLFDFPRDVPLETLHFRRDRERKKEREKERERERKREREKKRRIDRRGSSRSNVILNFVRRSFIVNCHPHP